MIKTKRIAYTVYEAIAPRTMEIVGAIEIGALSRTVFSLDFTEF